MTYESFEKAGFLDVVVADVGRFEFPSLVPKKLSFFSCKKWLSYHSA
jgi:hypothetical protein